MNPEEEARERFVTDLKRLVEKGYIWQDEMLSCGLSDALSNYVIASVDGGPEDGKVVLADIEQVKKVMGLVDEG